ncbi:MAG: O-antigen ligase family protein [Patescibacteria group bacterium]
MENNNNIFKKSISQVFFWGFCLILFLPIVILPPTFQPADYSRAILFRSAIALLLFFLLFRFFYPPARLDSARLVGEAGKKDASISLPKWKTSAYLPFLLLSAFFIILILSTLFSQDIKFSIFGSPTRAGGILNLLFFFVFALLLPIFTNENTWKKLFNFLFVIGSAVSLFGIVQYFNILKNVFISYESGNTPSFLGNSTFLAIYMIFLVFLSFTFLIQEKDKKKKIIYACLFLLFIFTILITGARATYLGLLTGFVFFFFFYPKKFKTLKIIAAFLVLSAVVITVFFNVYPQIGEKNNLLKIAADKLSIEKIIKYSLGNRLAAWKITLQAIKDKPLLGWGPENFYIGFEKYYDPNIKDVKNMWWDRPHNIFLDIAASSGIISLILYISFWVVLLWQLQMFKRKQGDEEKTYFAHGVQAMFLGYLVALFFNFDSFSTYTISFFFIGYSFYLISFRQEKIESAPPQKSFLSKKPVLGVFIVFLILFLWFWNLKPLYLNEKISYAENLAAAKKCDKAMVVADEIWQNAGILNAYPGLRYTDLAKRCASLKPEKEADYVLKGYEALKSASVAQPKFTRAWLFFGAFTNALAAKEKNLDAQKQRVSEAESYLKKALEISPKRTEIFIEIEKGYLIAKDYQVIKKTTNDCIKIDSSYGQCYWYLGVAEIFLGDQENGKKHIEEALKKNPAQPLYVQLGAAYISQKNYKDAAEAYRLAILFGGEKNASWHATLAFLYKQIGEYKKAEKSAIEVFKLQPENKEVLEFLKQLLGLNPNDPALHSSLAYIYTQTGQTEKARQEYLIVKSAYMQAVAMYPNNPNHHFSLAGVLKELGEYEKAYQEALLAEKLDTSFQENVSNFINTLPGDYFDIYLGRKK